MIEFALLLVVLILLVVLFHCFCEIKILKTKLALWKDAAGKPFRPEPLRKESTPVSMIQPPRKWPR